MTSELLESFNPNTRQSGLIGKTEVYLKRHHWSIRVCKWILFLCIEFSSSWSILSIEYYEKFTSAEEWKFEFLAVVNLLLTISHNVLF